MALRRYQIADMELYLRTYYTVCPRKLSEIILFLTRSREYVLVVSGAKLQVVPLYFAEISSGGLKLE